MLELELDDAFWRDALGAVRGAGVHDLSDRRPEFAALVEDLLREAESSPILVGGRLACPGRNGRLLLFLIAALLARRGRRTLFLDLSADLRWLEHLVGEGLKEGLIDHLRYGVPLERCARPTALPDLAVLTGGAYFLAGSPLEDAPGLRAALETLRGRYAAVVLAFPHPVEAADAAGLPARCDVLVTVEEGETGVPPVGSERAVIRLVGDPHAARDLVRLTDAFLGPLPLVLAAPVPVVRPQPAAPPPPIGRPDLPSRRARDEIDFLRTFEDDRSRSPEPPRPETATLPSSEPEEPAPVLASTRPRGGRRRSVLPVLAITAIGLSAVGLAVVRLGPRLAGDGKGKSIAVIPAEEEGIAVPLEPPIAVADSGTDPAPLDSAATPDTSAGPPAEVPGTPVPWSVHVGSYQTVESGRRLVNRIAETGEIAFLAPVDLPGRGRWNRVYAGAFADSTEARAALDRLLAEGVVEEGVIRLTPWAFRVGATASREEARRRLDELERRGVPAYLVGGETARVYAGAYRDEEEASLLAHIIEGTDETVLDLRRN